MNLLKSAALATTAIMLGACNPGQDESGDIIDRPDYHSESGIFDIEALEALGRVTDPQVSPDGKTVLFGVSYENVEKNASNRDLYTVPTDGGDVTRITKTPKSENGAVWLDQGNKIAFMYPDVDGNLQVWTMDPDGNNRRQISQHKGGVSAFLFSPDQTKAVIIGNVKYSRNADDIYPDLPKATGRVIDDLMYKHWDEWVTEIPHPFVGNYDGKQITDLEDIMSDEPYEAPMKPFGGVESFAWSPDSKSLVYVSRKKTGKEYAISTNSDLYLYTLADKTTRNLTEGMMGYDTCPAFSPDGTKLAWLSMARDGYEADKNRLFILDIASGQKTDLTANWDYTIDLFCWQPDGSGLYFIAYKNGDAPIFQINTSDHTVTQLTQDPADYCALSISQHNRLITMRHSMLRPNEVMRLDINGTTANVNAITDINGSIFAQLTMPTITKHFVPTTDGKEMLTYVLLPPGFDENKKYPAILYCQGGPQSSVSQAWSYRWNFALMASNGYIIILPNRRGVPGFGTEWEEQISKDYPGQNIRDYLAAVDYMKQKPYVDPEHIGATGASYGGFSIYYLAGNHQGRFAALLAHAGIFNMEAQYLETEEMWFANWDMGGAYWEKDNTAAQRTFANSPHRFVDRWDTPIMISHGEYDYRILASQGMAAFNAAKLRGIPAEMVIFPDENHWILKPQNAVLWQRLFFRWFDKWLKPQNPENE